MGRTKHLKEVIEGLKARIREHEEKIERELQKPNPNWARIDYWRKEIRTLESRRDRLLDRLYRRRRKKPRKRG